MSQGAWLSQTSHVSRGKFAARPWGRSVFVGGTLDRLRDFILASVKDVVPFKIYASLCSAVQQQKLLSSPCFGALKAQLPRCPLLRSCLFSADAGINGSRERGATKRMRRAIALDVRLVRDFKDMVFTFLRIILILFEELLV